MVRRLLRVLRIYAKLQLLHLRTYMEYEADFWIGIIGMGLRHGAGFLFIWTIFHNIPEVEGWRMWEVAILYALVAMAQGLVNLLCDGQWSLRGLVNRGDFDRLLLRPISPAIQVIAQTSSIHGLGGLILGGTVLVVASRELGLAWSLEKLAFLWLTMAGAVMLIGSITFVGNCIAFWEPSASGAFPILLINTLEFAKYPITIYSGFLRVLVTWLLPIAFVSYFPALVLLEKEGDLGWLPWLSPLAGPLVMLAANVVWRLGLSRYQGTGS